MVKDVSELSKCELIETVERLQADRAELESELIRNTDLLPYEPIRVAERLISTSQLKTKYGDVIKGGYDISDLRQIAEHLLIYANAGKEIEDAD